MRLINPLILVTAFLFISCDKEDKRPVESDSRLDFVVLKHSDIISADTIRSISYDEQGRMTRFAYDAYLYNAANKVYRIDCYYPKVMLFLDILMADHYYGLQYDNSERMTEVSDATFYKPQNDVTYRPGPDRNGYRLIYEGNMVFPSILLQDYYSSLFGFESAVRETYSNVEQRTGMRYIDGNVIESVTTAKGIKGSKWEPGPGVHFEKTTKTTFSHDNRGNVLVELFGSLGFIPEVLLPYLRNERSLFYSKNNVTRMVNGEESLSLRYSYDAKDRVIEMKVGETTTIKFFYK